MDEFLNSSHKDINSVLQHTKEILHIYSGTDNIDANKSRGEQYLLNHNYTNPTKAGIYRVYAYERDVSMLEAFSGREFSMMVEGAVTREVIGTRMSNDMRLSVKELVADRAYSLLAQKLYKDSIVDVDGDIDTDGVVNRLNSSLYNEPTSMDSVNLLSVMIYKYGLNILKKFDQNIINGANIKNLLSRNNISFNISSDSSISGRYGDTVVANHSGDSIALNEDGIIFGGAGDDILKGSSNNYSGDIIYGGKGNDSIYGDYGSDELHGGDGDDAIYAGDGYGSDILIGGKGNDMLHGNSHNSTYIYRYGDGHDVIIDPSSFDGTAEDVLIFRDISSSEVEIKRVFDDVIVQIKDKNEPDIINGSITIKNGFLDGGIETLLFKDKTIVFKDIVYNNKVDMSNLYFITRYGGVRTIDVAFKDTYLQFNQDISIDDIMVKTYPDNDNLYIAIKAGNNKFEEQVIIKNYFDGVSPIKELRFFNAVIKLEDYLSAPTDKDNAIRAMAQRVDALAGNDTIIGNQQNNNIFGNIGDDTIDTRGGDDILEGGKGSDVLFGGSGNDTYKYALGDGFDTIFDASMISHQDDGNDTLEFKEGITKETLKFVYNSTNGDLVINIDNLDSKDRIIIKKFGERFNAIERLKFSNGAILSYEEIMKSVKSTSNADTVFVTRDSYDNNVKDGDDIYIIGKDSGNITIYDYFRVDGVSVDGGSDTLEFEDGISAHDVIVHFDGTDMVFNINNEDKSSTVTLKNWSNKFNRIENFKFSDGSKFDQNSIYTLILKDSNMLYAANDDNVIAGTDKDEAIHADDGDDTLYGDDGNDKLYGDIGDDVLYGGVGDDEIHGGVGNDILDGGMGNDTLNGGDGDDTYIFARGYGVDTIIDSLGNNTIKFKDISKDDIVVKLAGDSTIITLNYEKKELDGLYDNMIIKNESTIKSYIFKDAVLSQEDILDYRGTEGDDTLYCQQYSRNFNINLKNGNDIMHAGRGDDVIFGGDGSDAIYADDGDDTLYGDDGNDKLYGDIGDDVLYGGVGDDEIHGGVGNDILDGGMGNDTLNGGDGDDTYIFARGYGVDTIIDSLGNNTIKFKDISKDDIIVEATDDSDDIIISLKDDDSRLLISGWFHSKNRVDKFEFADGSILSGSDILSLQNSKFQKFTESNDTHNLSGVTTIKDLVGDETYIYKKGDGIKYIYDISGTDKLQFAAGISKEDIQIQAIAGSIIIVLKEDGKSFDELSEKIYIYQNNNDFGIEVVEFADGGTINPKDFINKYFGTDSNNIIDEEFLKIITPSISKDSSAIIDALDGYDEVILGNGSNEIINAEAITLGNGNNKITSQNLSRLSLGNGNNVVNSQLISSMTIGDGNNKINSKTLKNILLGNGNNEILADSLELYGSASIGNGNNAFRVGKDLSSTTINFGTGDNMVENIKSVYFKDGNNTIINANNIIAGNGDNKINSTALKNLSLGNGNNEIFVKDLSYFAVSVGDGDNVFQIEGASGRAEAKFGNGNNTIESKSSLNGDLRLGDGNNKIDNIATVAVGDGDNIIKNSEHITAGNGNNKIINASYVKIGNGNNQFINSNLADLHRVLDEGIKSGDVSIYAGDGDNSVDIGEKFASNTYASFVGSFGNGKNSIRLKNSYADMAMGGNGAISIDNDATAKFSDNEENNSTRAGVAIMSQIRQRHSFYLKDANYQMSIKGYSSYMIFDGSGSAQIELDSHDDNVAINMSGKIAIDSGRGDDKIFSRGNSDDTYKFYIGSGNDRIKDIGGLDCIEFGDGIDKNNIKVKVLDERIRGRAVVISYDENQLQGTGLSLVIEYGNSDKLILTDWFDNSRIEIFKFSDGMILNADDMVALIGSYESELVYGIEGSNVLNGQKGDDVLNGGLGNDTYIFTKGDGEDSLNDIGGFDIIEFRGDVVKDDLVFIKNEQDLKIAIKEIGKTYDDLSDGIEIIEFFNTSSMVERIIFGDGSTMELDEILSRAGANENVFYGTLDNDTLNGNEASEIFIVKGGNDAVSSGGGDDTILAGDGDDILDGGAGNDRLFGGDGDDTYIIKTNSGDKFIYDTRGIDKIEFIDSTKESAKFFFEGENLIIQISGTKIEIKDWFLSANAIEKFEFTDGLMSAKDAIDTFISNNNDIIKAGELGYAIDAKDGDDTVISSPVNDTLNGGNGNDTYKIGLSGSDTIFDTNGNDTIEFSRDILKDDLAITWLQGSQDISISLKNNPNSFLVIKNWYKSENRIENFKFADGTLLNQDDILLLMGSGRDDVYNGFEEKSSNIQAGGGDDIISTFEFNDILDGGSGNDSLDSGDGNDILVGGSGDDILIGGNGDDTYIFRPNFGKDEIIEVSGKDTIKFEGVSKQDIVFKFSEANQNLYIAINEKGKKFEELKNTITIKDYFSNGKKIENLQFDDEIITIESYLKNEFSNKIKADEQGGILRNR